MTTETQKNILLFLGITSGLGLVSLLTYNLIKNKTRVSESKWIQPLDDKNNSQNIESTDDKFPLKLGSKGSRVRQLQNILLAKFGSSILPRFGADGDFGLETKKALESKNLPVILGQQEFENIINGRGIDAKTVSKQIWEAIIAKDYAQVMNILKAMNLVSDYQKVSEYFKRNRTAGVHKTLVNGVLDAFQKPEDKQRIRNEFIRMGLQLRGGVFYLN